MKKYCEISDFGFAKVDKKFFLHQKGEIQTEILKRLIWNIGMKKYPTKIDSKILSDILNKKINTLGKCFIKIRKENIFIFREKRNLQKMNFADDSPFIWDKRFLIKTKLTNNQYIYSSGNEFNLPKDVLAGFPCLYENHKVKYSLDEWIKFVSFLKKPDLFDIFCGVHSE